MTKIRGCTCHKRACTRGRPLCRRTDSPRNVTCNCGNYPYPHRLGSGRCQAHPEGQARMNELAYGPEAKAG
jgi:hypothetical protein